MFGLRRCFIPLFLLIAVLLSACSLYSNKNTVSEPQDGAPLHPIDLSHVRNATPEPVVRTRAGNPREYTIFGETYRVMADSKGYRERGIASWYGTKFHGRKTSNGETYDMYAMTAAHKTLPIPSYVRVTHLQNGRSIVVRINDRGPFHAGRIIDLSYAAAHKLGVDTVGTGPVEVVDVTPASVAAISKIGTGQTVTTPSQTPVVVSGVSQPPLYLQVGAFQQRQGAVLLQQQIKGLLTENVFVLDASKDAFYRVAVGPVATNERLVAVQQLLSDSGLPKGHRIQNVNDFTEQRP